MKIDGIAKYIMGVGSIWLCLLYATETFAQTNLSQLSSTTVTTSRVSEWESLDAVNDGFTPESSTDRTNSIYGNWAGEGEYGEYNWVQYDWDFAHQISEVSVYWFTDFGGLLQPTDAYIEYWNGLKWINAGQIGHELNKFNKLAVDFMTSKVRISMKSSAATGIIEFQVLGSETTSCDATELKPYVKINNGSAEQQNYAIVSSGDHIQFTPDVTEDMTGAIYEWSGPDNFSSATRQITLSDLQPENSGMYTFTYINACGTKSTLNFNLTIRNAGQTDFFTSWPAYNPTISYDFKKDYPNFPAPTKNLESDYPGYDGCDVAWTKDYEDWTFVGGPNANSLVTDTAVTLLLKRLHEDFTILRDSMGWPPDKLYRAGYRSSVYLFGSGLCTDGADSTALGGWQGGVSTPDGEGWPMILLSYFPVASFDPDTKLEGAGYQTGAVVHEGIHALYASLPGCRNAAWFHEGSNVWLQGDLEKVKAGASFDPNNVDLGWLSMGSVMGPFMPIECYSGWLQDGTFGGPSAEGVYSGKFNSNSDLLRTTRALFGGAQYSTVFPTFLGEIIGKRSLPWIWNYCEGRVLEGIADSIGDYQTRRMVQEYRARLALADFGDYTQGVMKLYRNYMGVDVFSEQPALINVDIWKATPYARTTKDAGGFLVPDTLTLPGWSGANFVPIHVTGQSATVFFEPLGDNMSCQLCYRTKEGKTVYSPIVYGGDCTISFDEGIPANKVVFAVVCNTDYIYRGEETRTTKYRYRLKLGEGAVSTASVDKNWWDWTATISDLTTSTKTIDNPSQGIIIFPNPSANGTPVNIYFKDKLPRNSVLKVSTLSGQNIYTKALQDEIEQIPAGTLAGGMYIVAINTADGVFAQKIIVQ